MNKFFTIVISLFFSTSFFAQISLDTCVLVGAIFNPLSQPEPKIFIDSVNNPSNIWQVGIPEKDNINLPFTPDLSIVTDTMLPYPTNDTSSFIIPVCHYFGQLYPGTTGTEFEIDYYMDSDSLNDFGKIEVSLDSGQVWWDYETTFGFDQIGPSETILTGNSGGKKTMVIDPMSGDGTLEFLTYADSLHNNGTIKQLLIKFSFISDNTPDNKMGWLISKITQIQYLFSSTEDISNQLFQTSVFPNPATSTIQLQIESKSNDDYHLQIFSTTGQLIHSEFLENKNQTTIDISRFPQGLYHYAVSNLEKNQWSTGKIVVAE